MHPLLSDFRRFLWHIAIWLAAGLLLAKILVLAEFSNFSYACSFAVPVSLFFGFLTSSAYYICRSFQIQKYTFFLIALVFIISSLISAAVATGVAHAWNLLLENLTEITSPHNITSKLDIALFAIYFVFYLLALLTYDVVIAFEHIQAAEKRETHAHLLARDAELQVLRSQIDPHFLFNSLNSISALTAIDAKAAREMTIALADFFRKTLTLSEQEKVNLEQELSLCEDFLAVEKIRFGKKLQINIEADDSTKDALIPSMILQPLLENAIKPGIRTIRQGGCITVKILRNTDWLYIRVTNPVTNDISPATGSGLGLQNLRSRFHALYDDQARVEWKRTEQEFVVELTLPWES
ncbi:sensor histidine kinase [Undibacterium sp. Ji67W]|uniref:sensor histidine kinase n=1 Tax=Undibacterium sp. Ji67W TaxID=3413042 RepID=UPI003BF225CB